MLLIHNGTIVNQGVLLNGYVVIDGQRIVAVTPGIPSVMDGYELIDACGGYIIPGVIDDQVHFREPGMTEKGDIRSESRAAVAGGVTSFMEMPNTKPAAVTHSLLEQKYDLAAAVSPANYSFYMGATNDNINEIRNIDPRRVCGVKVFMGSSTGNMLVDRKAALEAIFAESPTLVATHCEDEQIVSANLRAAFEKWGDNIPIAQHPIIRSAQACYRSSAQAAELATRYGAHLHILHISTELELSLFSTQPLSEKKITAEVCAHHLWYSDSDYATKGTLIKCNPAIKTAADRSALRHALTNGKLDVVATDHAPHTLQQKLQPYTKSPSGLPLVQHSLAMMLQMGFPIADVVKYMCHNPAELFKIQDRGYIKPGQYADIAIIQSQQWEVTPENVMYKCGWSPLQNTTLTHQVSHTIVNGQIAYQNGEVTDKITGQRLTFNR